MRDFDTLQLLTAGGPHRIAYRDQTEMVIHLDGGYATHAYIIDNETRYEYVGTPITRLAAMALISD